MLFLLPSRLHTQVLPGRKRPDPRLPWILVVAHDASRTGAPIVAQNLANVLSTRYNVVLFSQRGGTLLEQFRDACVEVRVPRRVLPRPLRVRTALSALSAERPLRFAILNSAETHPSSTPLEQAGVPIIALMHEFAAYLGNHRLIAKWFEKSNALVFSSALTRDDAARRIGLPSGTTVTILPQGKCVVPGSGRNSSTTSDELGAKLRPVGSESAFLVLGAGTVDYRKGVDLFVSLAAIARSAAPEIPWRFVWIGGQLTSSSSGDYRLYVADQIERLDVGHIVSVLPPTPDIESAYRSANLFLLPSRLDPLPNVAIDALAVGLPVLSFNNATGLGELQRGAGLDEACLAPYLDLAAMTDRLIAFARSSALRREVGEASARLARKLLQMEDYASAISEIAEMIVASRKK